MEEDMREIGPEEAKIRAQTGVGLSGVESPWVAKPYDAEQDRDPCPWCGKRHRNRQSDA